MGRKFFGFTKPHVDVMKLVKSLKKELLLILMPFIDIIGKMVIL